MNKKVQVNPNVPIRTAAGIYVGDHIWRNMTAFKSPRSTHLSCQSLFLAIFMTSLFQKSLFWAGLNYKALPCSNPTPLQRGHASACSAHPQPLTGAHRFAAVTSSTPHTFLCPFGVVSCFLLFLCVYAAFSCFNNVALLNCINIYMKHEPS